MRALYGDLHVGRNTLKVLSHNYLLPDIHGLAGMTQQMRLELRPRGIHVGLVSPGPIARDDAGRRYTESIDASIPEQASAPGGGTRLKGLAAERVADAVLRCIRHRAADIVLPGYLRILIAIGHAFPRLGDWLLIKFTSSAETVARGTENRTTDEQ